MDADCFMTFLLAEIQDSRSVCLRLKEFGIYSSQKTCKEKSYFENCIGHYCNGQAYGFILTPTFKLGSRHLATEAMLSEDFNCLM